MRTTWKINTNKIKYNEQFRRKLRKKQIVHSLKRIIKLRMKYGNHLQKKETQKRKTV